jgi:hypothetical protein
MWKVDKGFAWSCSFDFGVFLKGVGGVFLQFGFLLMVQHLKLTLHLLLLGRQRFITRRIRVALSFYGIPKDVDFF